MPNSAVDPYREPVDQYRDKIKRLFAYGPSVAPSVQLARIGDNWTPIHGVEGIVGRDCPLPPGSVLAGELSVTMFEWHGAFPPHQHEEQETIHVMHGRIEVVVEGRTHVLGAGESITLGARVSHHGHTLEPSLLVCSYHPPLAIAT